MEVFLSHALVAVGSAALAWVIARAKYRPRSLAGGYGPDRDPNVKPK